MAFASVRLSFERILPVRRNALYVVLPRFLVIWEMSRMLWRMKDRAPHHVILTACGTSTSRFTLRSLRSRP